MPGSAWPALSLARRLLSSTESQQNAGSKREHDQACASLDLGTFVPSTAGNPASGER
jgi:hypothetical protein